MRPSNALLLLCPLLVVLTGCCSTEDGDWSGSKICCSHLEGPFGHSDDPPDPALVLGTADFNSSGAVLIKIQVEDQLIPDGNTAAVTAWSGMGTYPAAADLPPADSYKLYDTGGDTNLRFWTTHLDRKYSAPPTSYWVVVRVIHRVDGVAQPPVYTWQQWTPTFPATLDPVHEFIQYPPAP